MEIFKQKLLPRHPPIFREWFLRTFPDPTSWWVGSQPLLPMHFLKYICCDFQLWLTILIFFFRTVFMTGHADLCWTLSCQLFTLFRLTSLREYSLKIVTWSSADKLKVVVFQILNMLIVCYEYLKTWLQPLFLILFFNGLYFNWQRDTF